MNGIMNVTVLVNGSQPMMRPEVTTTEMLRDLCAQMDSQAFYVAVGGFVVSVASLFYYGRLRPKLLDKDPAWLVPFLDKLLQTGTALMFAVIIVRLLRAG